LTNYPSDKKHGGNPKGELTGWASLATKTLYPSLSHTLLNRWHKGLKERFHVITPPTHKGAKCVKLVGFREGDADAEYQTADACGLGVKAVRPRGRAAFCDWMSD